jgi:hypothetical protein
MTISTTGVAGLKTHHVQHRQDTTGVSAASGTTSTAATSTDQLTISAAAQQASGQNDPFQTDLDSLASALKSGDLETARKAYATMAAEMQKHGDLPSDFAAIGTALDSGDLTAAQSALQTVQKNVAGHQPPASGTNPLQQDMDKLGQLISTGDSSSAQSLLDQILAKLTGTSSSGTGTDSSSSDTAFQKAIKDLKAALAAGNTTSATTAYQTLLAQVQAGAGLPSGTRSLESIASAAYQSSASLA